MKSFQTQHAAVAADKQILHLVGANEEHSEQKGGSDANERSYEEGCKVHE